MRAVAEDQIEQDHGDARIVSRVDQRGIPSAGIDDRMRPSPRELFGAEVDEAMRSAAAHDALRFVAQCPARIEAADRPPCAARGPVPGSFELADRAAGETDRGDGRLFQRRRRPDAGRRRPLVTEQAGHDRFSRLHRGPKHGVGNRGRGRLRDDERDSRVDVRRERFERLERGETADGGVEVTPAGADRMRDTTAEAMHEARHLLDAGSGGSDDADGPATDPVREAETDPIDHGRPALRPHDQEAAGVAPTLERDLVVQRHAVAEEEHMKSGRERLMRVERGIGSRNGDDRDVGRRASTGGARGRARHHVLVRRLAIPARAQELLDALQRAVRDRLGARTNGDQEIAGAGLRCLRRPQPRVDQHRAARRRSHHDRDLSHAGQLPGLLGNAHEVDRIEVRVSTHRPGQTHAQFPRGPGHHHRRIMTKPRCCSSS